MRGPIVDVNLEMSVDERHHLLGLGHVGVLAVAAPGGLPLVSPLWYALDDGGDVLFVTGRTTRKVRLLEEAEQAVFLVHEDGPPRHVAAEGDIVIEEPDDGIRRRIAERDVPPDQLVGYLSATAAADTVVVRLRPTAWRSVDLSKAVG